MDAVDHGVVTVATERLSPLSKFKIVLLVCGLLAATTGLGIAADAPAADDKRLSVEDVVWINSALSQLNCGGKVIKDGTKETFICEPYKWSPGINWMIATNLRKAQEIATQYNRLRGQAVANLTRKPDGTPADDAQAKFAVDDRKMLDDKITIDLGRFKRGDLEPMNLPPSVIAGLLPIID